MLKIFLKKCFLLVIIFCGISSINSYGAMNFLLKAKLENNRVPDLSNNDHYGILKGGVRFDSDKFVFNGKKSELCINASSNLNTGDSASYVAIVKFSNVSNNALDAVIFKQNQFVLSKKGKVFYCNFFNGKKWCAKLYSPGNIELVANHWYHLVLTFKRYGDSQAGEDKTAMKLYVDGRCVAALQRDYMYPADSNNPVQVGNGFGGGWRLHGAISEVRMYDKALSKPEIDKLISEQKFVKPVLNMTRELSSEERSTLKQIRKTAAEYPQKMEVGMALAGALETIAKTKDSGIDFSDYAAGLKQAIGKSQDSGQVLEYWNSLGKVSTISNKYVFLTFIYDPAKYKFSFVNMYDSKSGRNIFKAASRLWKIKLEHKGKHYLFNPVTGKLQAKLIQKPVRDATGWHFTLEWTHLYFTVRSQFTLNGKRLDYDLSAKSRSSEYLIKQVVFPSMELKELDGEKDVLLVPMMSGAEHFDPVNRNFSYSSLYPSNYAVIQMGAYYNKQGGVYFATEDVRAQTKQLSFVSGNKGIEIEYAWNVGFRPGVKNAFEPDTKAVFEIMRGNWYDAGLIYRQFLADSKPVWWTENLPRKDTPEWFRNNCLWLRQWVRKSDFKENEKNACLVRKYFQMPFAIHWYSWHGEHDQDYPHYKISSEFHELMKRLQSKDIKIIPYVNGRIWDTKDRGDEDWQYSKIALPATAKNSEGKVYTSVFKKRLFAIMCPYTQVWQKQLLKVADKVLGFGFNGIYWDQVSGAAPVFCYDKSHGHLLGDCDLWFMKGNYKIFSNTRALSKKKYSDAAFFSEDNAEPYSRVFDGALCWRWMIKTQVPLFQLIYSGRLQFIGLHYTLSCEGKKARYSKTAKQLVYSEQMGWFTIKDLCASSKNYRLFLKKAIFVRKAMLKFFNEGMMGRPIKFLNEMKVFSRKWGIYETSYVNSPEIVSSAWKYKDIVAYLMVNTTENKVSQKIAFNSSSRGINAKKVTVNVFGSSGSHKKFESDGKFERELDFTPYSMQLWLISSPECKAQEVIDTADRIFQKIGKFTTASDPF